MSPHFRAALALSSVLLAAAPARAADIALDQAVLATGAKGKVTFKNVLLSDCNLSQSEASSLFSGSLTREETGALLERMSAKEMKIPEAEFVTERGDHFVLHDIVVGNITKGGADSLTVASIDGVMPDDSGDATFHSGLLRFQTLSMAGLAAALRGADLGLPSYRFAHLDWDGGDLSLVDKGTPAGAPGGNRILVHAGLSHVDQTFDADGAQLSVDAHFNSLSVKMPPQSKGGTTLSAFGYQELSAEAHFAGAYDPVAKNYKLADYSFDLRQIGKIAFSGQFSGLDKTAFLGDKEARTQAMQAATVDWAEIDVTNSGLFDKVVAFVSLSQGRSPDQIKTEWRSVVSQAPLLFSGAPAIGVTARAVDRFIVDPKTLVLRVKGKDAPLKVADLLNIADPMAFVNRLDVTSAPAAGKP